MNGDDKLIEPIASEQEDSQISLPSYDILTYPADYTLEVLVKKWDKKEITIPPLQRGFVWTQAQASKLIESFLLGLPVPPVFLYQDREDNSLLVIDGHQRIRSIVYFFSGLFGEPGQKTSRGFGLVGLDEKSLYLGKTYQWLRDENDKAFNKLNNSVLRAFIMKQIDPADDTSIFQVFERLNSGGVALNGQEIRNCLYEGAFNTLLIELNKTPAWRNIVGRKSPDKRMRDIELILRFFALFYNINKYEKPMKKFLNDFMKTHKVLSGPKRKQFTELFQATTNLVVQALGDKPFHIHRGLNAAVYDSVFTAFARHVHDSAGELKAKDRAQFLERYAELITDKNYLEYTTSSTTDKDVVPKRIDRAEQLLFR